MKVITVQRHQRHLWLGPLAGQKTLATTLPWGLAGMGVKGVGVKEVMKARGSMCWITLY